MNLYETYPLVYKPCQTHTGHPSFFQQPYIEPPRNSSPAIPSGPQLPQFIRPPAPFIPNQQLANKYVNKYDKPVKPTAGCV
jgi:hypothetical protein